MSHMPASRLFGWALISIAFFVTIQNVGDQLADLREWHGVTTPQFIGALLKNLGATGIAAVGGKLLPSDPDDHPPSVTGTGRP